MFHVTLQLWVEHERKVDLASKAYTPTYKQGSLCSITLSLLGNEVYLQVWVTVDEEGLAPNALGLMSHL